MRRKYQQMYFREGKELLLLTHLFKPIEISGQLYSLAGFVKSTLLPGDIALVIDNSQSKETEYEYACAIMDNLGKIRVLIESEVYWDIIRGKAYARTTLLHELGHIYNNDLREIGVKGSTYDSERLKSIQSGIVHEREIKADAFAVRFLGISVVCEGLSVLRQNHINEGDEADSPSVSELTRRIELLIAASHPS